jgi:FkbM family methyltransferase
VQALTGSQFCGRTSDFHAYPFSVHGYFYWRNWAIALACCSPGDRIVEVGANIGTETVGFRDIVGRNGEVVAFEPWPDNLDLLHRLVSLNRWSNVRLFSFALWSTDGELAFVRPPDARMSGIGHIQASSEQGQSNTIRVECVTLDSVGQIVGPAQGIFIDAEGAEAAILQGARHYLRRWSPAIVLEASPKLLTRAGSSLALLHSLVMELDYRPFRISRLGLETVAGPTASKAANWFCIPASRPEFAEAADDSVRKCGLLPCFAGLNPMISLRPP